MGRYKWVIRLGGLGLFGLVLWRADVGKIISTLSKVDPLLVTLSVVLVVPFVILKAWRWQVILRSFGIKISAAEASQLYAIGLSAGAFTPGQAGDALKAWYLKKMGHGLSVPLISTVVDRLFDLTVILCFALTGVFVFWRIFRSEAVVLVALLAVLAALLVVLSNRRWRNGLVRSFVNYVFPRKLKETLGERDAYAQLGRL
ncbi:MAG: flippase-like domain-containing protein, partial [Chloroflexi bacterium]|nr:flippase-like domain-containing protein [Chloroflexota bacterium]